MTPVSKKKQVVTRNNVNILVTRNTSMVKGKKQICYEAKCPTCKKEIHTEKIKSVQCRKCGKRFDIE